MLMKFKILSRRSIISIILLIISITLALINRDILGLGRYVAFTEMGSRSILNSHERPSPIMYVLTDKSEVSDFIKLYIEGLTPSDVRQELLARLENLDYDTNVAVFIGVESSRTAVQTESVVVVDDTVNIRVHVTPYPGFGPQVVFDPYQVIAIEKAVIPGGIVTFNIVNNFFKIASTTKSITYLSLSRIHTSTN